MAPPAKPKRPTARIKPIEDRRLLGISMVLLAVLLFAGIDTAAKFLVISGIPSTEVVFARFAVNLLLVFAVLMPAQGPALFVSANPKLEIVRAAILLLSTVFNFFAVRYLPLTVTGSIVFALPLFVAALSGPLLGEQVGWRRWAAILVGFGGVLVIVRPGGEAFHWAAFLSIGSVVCAALYNIATRRLAGVDSAYTQQFYAALVATAGITPFAFGAWVWPHNAAGWLAFVAMGGFGFAGHLLLTTAHRLAPASVLAPFVYTQILYMTASSWLVFGQAPDGAVFLGAPIVIGSGLYIWIRERQLALKAEMAPLS